MATLKDVARETGLTVSTVSRVLNNRGYISKEAREKVYAAMKKLNYQPNELARSLSKQTTNTIGVILPYIDHPYFARVLSCLETAAFMNGYRLVVFNSNHRDDKEQQYLEMCKGIRVAGVILCSGSVREQYVEELGVPLVALERSQEGCVAVIECDNRQGGRLAAKHLSEKGCRTVAYLGSDEILPASEEEREKGFLEICVREGLACIEPERERADGSRMGCKESIERLLTEHPEVDGIFAGNDVAASWVIQICGKKGIQIPQQLKVVGFDDSMVCTLTSPEITTVHQPIPEMASLAVESIVRVANKEEVHPRTVRPVSLIRRETT